MAEGKFATSISCMDGRIQTPLTKWIRENVKDSRVLIITDRQELDGQIEKLFTGVEEKIYRTKSGRDLISVLNQKTEML